MASWEIISTCTGAVQSASGLYAARFFLGFVEACFYPGCIFLLSSWYKRSELSLRCAILYGGSQVGSAFSGLIAAGITSGLDGALGLRAWRWIFVSLLTEHGLVVVACLLTCRSFTDHRGFYHDSGGHPVVVRSARFSYQHEVALSEGSCGSGVAARQGCRRRD
jgi:MFS family permease